MLRVESMDVLGLRNRTHFVKEYLQPALELGVIEMTIPDKPNSSKQRYRLSALGRHHGSLVKASRWAIFLSER